MRVHSTPVATDQHNLHIVLKIRMKFCLVFSLILLGCLKHTKSVCQKANNSAGLKRTKSVLKKSELSGFETHEIRLPRSELSNPDAQTRVRKEIMIMDQWERALWWGLIWSAATIIDTSSVLRVTSRVIEFAEIITRCYTSQRASKLGERKQDVVIT